jgi:hypothetical protein
MEDKELGDTIFLSLNISSASPDIIWTNGYLVLSRANRVITFADELTKKQLHQYC